MTFVEGDLKSPFSIANTISCRGGRYSFLLIDLYLRMLNIKHQVPFFEFLVWLELGLNPGLQDH